MKETPDRIRRAGDSGPCRRLAELPAIASSRSGRFRLAGMRICCCLAALSLLPGFSTAAHARQLPDESVVVTANTYPVPFDNLSRTVTVLTREDIARMPVRSLADVLAYAASVDVMSRGPNGMQADISIRGASFSQALILVDGVRINDSQTAHHNADLPVPIQDVERIEVLSGSGSALYGADALGGIVNIITRRHRQGAYGSVSAGDFGYLSGSAGVSLRKGSLEQSLSASADRSSGFRYDRDFRSILIRSRTASGAGSSLSVSHLNKEFGADGFYGPSPSREWTNQTLVAYERPLGTRPDSRGALQAYYRTHGDRFLYDIRTPGLFESRHRTHSAGILLKSQWSRGERFLLSYGGTAGADAIASRNLGNHGYGRLSIFGEMKYAPRKSAVIYGGLRWDYYSSFGSAVSPSLSASWWVRPRFRLRSAVARAFRIPTFTELYYRDPNNEGSLSVRPETSWSAETGGDLVLAGNWLGSLVLFSRRQRDVIDWIRHTPSEKWRTFNIGRLRTNGLEVGLERHFPSESSVAIRYTCLAGATGPIDYISKYALDYARHAVTAFGAIRFPHGVTYSPTLRFRRRADGRSYLLLDARLEKRLHKFVASVGVTNMLGSSYQEIRGVDMPGRWLTLGLARE